MTIEQINATDEANPNTHEIDLDHYVNLINNTLAQGDSNV